MRPITKEWLKASYDDIRVIEKIYQDEILSHMVAFHAQQSIEKSFKAILEEHEIEFPKVHKLRKLQTMLPVSFESIDDTLIKILDELYIESRYPGDIGLLPHGKPTLEDAKEFYNFALHVFYQTCSILSIVPEELK